MANEDIDIRIREDGSRVVRRNIDGIAASGSKAGGAIRMLQLALGGLTVGLAVTQFVRMLDVTTNINNRLRLVTNNTAELNAVYNELRIISNDTRQSLEANATLFNSVARGTRDLNLSYRQQLDFVKQLNQATVISGASTVGASAAMYQLGQALATGVLRGEEYNSVNENIPVIMDAVAASMGVPRGALRQLAEEGKITAQVLIDAMSQASEDLTRQFAQIAPTVAGAFTVLNNEALNFVRDFSEATAIGQILATMILFVADNFEIFVAGAMAVALILTAAVIPAFVALTAAMMLNPFGFIVVAIAAATVALAAFGGTSIEVAGTTATVWQTAQAVFMTLIDIIGVVRDTMVSLFGEMTTAASPFFETVGGYISDFMGWWADASDVIFGVLKALVNNAIALFVGMVGAIGPAITEGIPALFKLAMAIALNFVIAGVQAIINVFARGLAGIGAALEFIPGLEGAGAAIEGALSVDFRGAMADVEGLRAEVAGVGADIGDAFSSAQVDYVGAFAGAVTDAGAAVSEMFGSNLNTVVTNTGAGVDATDLLSGNFGGGTLPPPPTLPGGGGGAGAGGAGGSGGSTASVADTIASLNQEAAALRMVSSERDIYNQILSLEEDLKRSLTDAEKAQVAAAMENLAVSREAGQILDDLRGPQEEFETRLAAINMLLQDGTLNAQEYSQAMLELGSSIDATGNTLFGGISAGLNRVMAQTSEFGEGIANWVVGSFDAASAAVVDFAKTGKIEFDAFFQGIFANLLKLATDQLFSQLLGAALGGAVGVGGAGVGGLFGSLLGFAEGGSIMPSGTGTTDSQTVAFRKRPDERVDILTPAQQRAQDDAMNGGGGGSAPANVQVAVVLSEDDIENVFSGERGDRIIVRGIQRNSSTVRQVVNK